MKTQKTKTIVVLLLVFALCVALAGVAACKPNESDNTDVPSDHVHTLTAYEAQPSTCSKQGNIAYWQCGVCSKYFSDSNGKQEIANDKIYIPALSHIDTDENCICDNCGNETHTSEQMQDVSATCTETGLAGGVKCSACGKILVEQQIQPALCHDLLLGTCTRCGVKTTMGLDFEEVFENVPIAYVVAGIGTATDTDLVIPDTYNGLPVVAIKDYAFSDCENISTVTIPHLIQTIGKCAFQNCTNLESVSVPLSVNVIGKKAFSGCRKLANVELSYGALEIQQEAFSHCVSLREIMLPATVVSVDFAAFFDCPNLTVYSQSFHRPVTWDSAWNVDFCPVVWNCISNTVAEDDNVYAVVGDIKYVLKDGNATIARQALVGDVVIPSEIYYGDKTYRVTDIVPYAFSSCTELTRITLPSSLVEIPAYAFADCSSLIEVNIPNSIKSIGAYAFDNCAKLDNVKIPLSVTTVGENIGSDIKFLCEAKSKPANWHEKWGSGAWDYKNQPEVTGSIVETKDKKNPEYDIVQITLYQGNLRFYNYWLRLYGSIKRYEVSASLEQWKDQHDVTIPAYVYFNGDKYTVTSVSGFGNWSGYGETDKSLTLKSIKLPNTITDISSEAFRYCVNLSNITLPNSVQIIWQNAFQYCKSLTSINIPSSVTQIGNAYGSAHSVFINCPSLTIYCEATSTPSNWPEEWNCGCPVVWNCKYNDVATDGYIYTVVDGVRYALKDGIAEVAVQPSNLEGKINIPSTVTYKNKTYSVTKIRASAFANCPNVTEVLLPNTLTAIGDNAFNTNRLTYLNSLVIPANVTSVGKNIVYQPTVIYCEAPGATEQWDLSWNSASKVVWDCLNNDADLDGTIYTTIDDITFALKNGVATVCRIPFAENVAIPSKITYKNKSYDVTEIGSNHGYLKHNQLINLQIPDCVCKIYWGFTQTTLKNVFIDDLVKFIEIDVPNNMFGFLSNKSNLYLNGELITKDIIIPKEVTKIGGIFMGSIYEKSWDVTTITFEEGSQCTSIADHAFSYSSLTSITIPASVTSIGEYAFVGCNNLTTVTIPASVTRIYYKTFSGCSSLTIYCEATSKPSGWGSDWNWLTDNTYCPVVWDCNNNDKDKDGYAYAVIDGIRYALKDNEATVVRQPSNITVAKIPAKVTYKGTEYSVTSIGNEAFRYCSNFTVIIGNSVTSVGKWAFANCSSLTIYCEATSKPSGWDSYWNYSNCPVVWGYKPE